MPGGKPAGVPCVNLDADLRCTVFGAPSRPTVCGSLQPNVEMCGDDRAHALAFLSTLERLTTPGSLKTTAPQRPERNQK